MFTGGGIGKIVTLAAGLTTAVAVGLPPLMYFLLSYQHEQGSLESAAELNSQPITEIIGANPDLWEYESIRLNEFLAHRPRSGVAERRRVLSLRGAVVAESVDPLPHPWLTQSLPLLDAGATVGTLEITRSIRPLLTRSAVLGLLLLPLGLLAFRMMRTLPLRALRRSEEEAQRQRETARRYEEELRHAEKLRAVGQLAAGVAHDFNNLLAVIKGCAAQLDREVPAESPLRDDVDEIMGAVERATSLTRSLLAFAHRQPMRLQPVDLVSVLRGCERSLRRVLREGIQLESRLPAEELPVMADPTQIEQILLNLALNAQDAMPYGGRVSIAASRVSLDGDEARRTGFELPGAYAELRVADDGVGMDPDTRARLFEPFFTTKDVGKGTGLGLSIVYGLVQQHRGVVHVASERSRGTAVTLLLPLLAAAAGEAPASTVASS